MAFLDEECRMKDDDNVHPPAASTHSESARLLPRGMLTTTDSRLPVRTTYLLSSVHSSGIWRRGLQNGTFPFPHRTTKLAGVSRHNLHDGCVKTQPHHHVGIVGIIVIEFCHRAVSFLSSSVC